MCRFINADVYASTGQGLLSNNMFAYCLNNPVNRIDVNGSLSAGTQNILDTKGKTSPIPGSGGVDFSKGKPKTTPKVSSGSSSSSGGKAPKGNKYIDGLNNFGKTTNYAIVDELGKGIVKKATYRPYVSLTNPLQVANVSIKNAYALANNTLYCAANSVKGTATTVGLGTVVAFGYDVCMDYSRYGENTGDFCSALSITVGLTIVCLGVGLMCTGIGATMIACVSTGIVTGICGNVWKKYFIGY